MSSEKDVLFGGFLQIPVKVEISENPYKLKLYESLDSTSHGNHSLLLDIMRTNQLIIQLIICNYHFCR